MSRGWTEEALICGTCGEKGKLHTDCGLWYVNAKCGTVDGHCQTQLCTTWNEALERWERLHAPESIGGAR